MALAEPMRNFSTTASQVGARLPWPVVFYLIAMVMPMKFRAGPLSMDGVRLILILFIIPLAINLLRGRYGRLILPDFLFVLHAVWMPFSLYVNNPQQMVEFAGSVSLEFMGGYLLARAFIRNKQQFIGMCTLMAFLMVLLMPAALFELRTGRPLITEMINKLPGIRSFPNGNFEPRMGLNRSQVVFQHPIHWGLFASSLFSLIYIGLRERISLFKRLILGGIIGVATFCSLSSGPLLALLIQFFCVGWAITFDRIKKRWWILLGLMLAAYILIDILSTRTPIEVFMTYATFSPHNAYWRALIFEYGMQNVWANPIFGLGLNDWERPEWMYTSSVDNFWLVIAMRHGFPGFLTLFIGYLYILIAVGVKKLPEGNREWHLRRAWMFTFVGLSFTLATVAVWGAIFSLLFFLLGAGVWFLNAEETADDDATEFETAADNSSRFQRVRPHSGERRVRAPIDRNRATSQKGGAKGQDFSDRSAQVANTRDTEAVSYTRFPIKTKSE